MDAYKSSRIKGYKSDKEIWNKLCEIHKSSQYIREQKKYLLVVKYASFKMEPYENVDKMYCRFIEIIKNHELLGKEYCLDKKNRKILNTLPKEWKTKIIAIEQVKNLNFVPIDPLVNSLTSYELKIK